MTLKLKMTVLRTSGDGAGTDSGLRDWMEPSFSAPDRGMRGRRDLRDRGDRATVSVETVALNAVEAADHARDPKVLALAPEMPVQLVRPTAVSFNVDCEDVSPPTGSWGLDAVGARRSGLTGKGVVVAILDTGIAKGHPAFEGVALLDEDIENFTGDADGDEDGHGTHCAGTILGRKCFGRDIGIAPGITKALVAKVIGKHGGSTDAIHRAMMWAQGRGAHVISMSLGMDFLGYQRLLVHDYSIENDHAFSLALAGYRANVRLFDRMSQVAAGYDSAVDGTVVVAAAGNESKRPAYAITVAPPAAAELFLSVGALEKARSGYRIAPFSNDGVSLVGPGVDIWSANKDDGLCRMSGTSMASPHVAGVAALYAERQLAAGRFKARTVIDQIRRGAMKLDGFAETDVGEGLVQAP